MELKVYNVEALSSLIAQPLPSPGGGSVCALTAAFAAALTAMIAGLGKEGKSLDARARVEQAQALRQTLLYDMQRDSESYTAFIAARRMPGGEARDLAVEASLRQAIEVPLEIATKALSLLPILDSALPGCPPGALPDAQVADLLARAAAKGSLLNARTNLSLAKADAYRAEKLAFADTLALEALAEI
jgi:formiminotetrahydrofolate cyclodeaminase